MIARATSSSSAVRHLAGKLTLLIVSAAVMAVALSGIAHADLDTYSTGDGHEGAVTVTTNSVLNYSAPINAAVSAGASSLTTSAGQTGATGASNSTGSAAQTQFEAGRLALVIQSSNYTGGGATSGSQADIDLSSGSVGRWELARIQSVTGSIAAGMTVNFSSPLQYSYSSTGAQIVAVPEFTTVQINSGITWSANQWNGSNGGVTAFLATGAVNMSASTSKISAEGLGFKGGVAYNTGGSGCAQLDGTGGGGKGEGIVSGVYPGTSATYASRGNIANAGGGGDCENAGGGGGGNGGAGGKGGYSYDGNRDVGGLGGTKLVYSAFDRAIFGGGGGAGDANNNVAGPGGNGGGLVFIRAASLTGSGTLSAAGAAGGNSAAIASSDGAGGGGAGGVVYARFTGSAACTLVSAKGGAGGNEQSTAGVHGPGGGGAGGRLVLQSSSGTCPANIANGVAGTTTGSGNSNRGSGPTSATDSTSSGATEAVAGGGGMAAPTAAVSTPADGAYVNTATPTITGTSGMTLGTIRVSIDGSYVGSTTTLANGTWSYTAASALTSGSHTYTVQPVYYGIAGSSTASRTLIVDTTAPSAPTVSSNRTGSTNQTTATITYTAAEGGGTMQCSTDGTTYSTCAASPVALSGLSDGVKTYYVRQVDAAGNVGAAASATWTVDTVAPAAPTVSSNRSGSTNQTTAQVTYTPAEAGGTVQCSTDGTTYATCSASPVSLAGLSDGVKTYYVRQVDAAGNTGTAASVTWTVDTVAPAAPTVSSNRTGSTNQTSATITYTAAEGGGTMQCSTDGTTYATCGASPVSLSGLSDGVKTYYVRQVDAAGNSGSVASVTWTVDTVAPAAPTVSSNRSGLTNQTTAQVTYTAAEGGGTMQCSTDGSTYSTCAASPVALSGLSDGVKTYYVRQVDAAGNNGVPASVSWTVDATPPAAPTVSSNRTGSTNQTSAAITYTAAEGGGTMQCSTDGTAYSTCAASPVSLSGLSDGVKTYYVRQIDAAGNTGSVASVTWTVDTAAPAAPTVSSNRSGSTNQTTATITYTAAEGGGTMQCSADGTTYSTCAASPVSLSGLTNGVKTYYVRQVDAAGNNGAAASVTWTVDTVAPAAPTVSSNRIGTTSQTTATITYTAAEGGGTMQCSTDGTTYNTCAASPISLSGLSDGVKTYYVRQVDAATNIGAAASVTWTVDTTPPAAPTVSSNRTGTTNQTSATITYTAAEGGGTMQCSTDGTTYSTCAASPISLTGLSDGVKTYYVRQVDAAGNNGSVASVTWTVDATPPAAPTVSSNRTGSTNQTTATITYTAAEGGGTMQCSTDGTTYSTCAGSPISLSGLSDGVKTYYVRQVDGAGNTGAAASATWTVDTAPPAAPTVSANRTGSTNQTTAQITYSATEGGGTMECSTDGTTYNTCAASPVSLSGLSDGVKTYFVRQRDAAGNAGGVASVTWTVDTSAPAAPTVSSNRSGSTSQTTATITYTAAEAGGTMYCSTDGTTYSVCAASPVSLSGLTDGAKTYYVRQQDAAGNNGAVASVGWTVDTAAPAAPTVSSNRSGTTSQTTAQITYTAAEAGGTMQCSTDGTTYNTCASSPVSLSGLTDGVKTYYVRQVDAAGNNGTAASVSWTVDTSAPAAPTVSSNRSGSVSSTTATITYTSAEAGGTMECSSDGTTYNACAASPISLSGLTDGTKNYYVRQKDSAGNTGPAASVTWIVDTVAPAAPSVSSNRTGSVNVNTATITYTAAEAGGTMQCSTDGTTYSTCGASPISLSGLSDGAKTYSVRQVDAAGNVGSVASVSWIVDTVAPAAPSVSSNRTGSTNQTTASITYTAAEGGGTMECSTDGTTYNTCAASPVGLSGLTDGVKSYYVRQKDAAGNAGTAASVSWTVDTVAPAAPTVSSNRSGSTNQTTAQVTYTAAEGGGTMQCSTDGTAYSTCAASPVSLSGLTDGAKTYYVRQVDAAGNIGVAASAGWTVDTIAPAAPTVSSNRSGSTNATTAQITYTAAEGGGTMQCSTDGTTYGACAASPISLSGLTDGAKTYYVRQVDTAGNVGSVASVAWVVDTSPPAAPTVSSNRSGSTNATTATITYTAAEGGGTMECSTDGTTYNTCAASPVGLSGLTDGVKTYHVRQKDAAGNNGTAASVSWTVDTAAPAAPTVSSNRSGSTNQTTAQVTYTAAEAGGTMQCSADGMAYNTCAASPVSLSGLSDGVKTYYVRQVDAAGNTGAAASVTWTVDTAPPAAPTVSSNRSGSTNQTNAQITYTAAEAGGTMQCSTDGTTFNTCLASPVTLTGLTDGAKSYYVRQRDAAGNNGAVASVSWTVDTVAPAAPAVGSNRTGSTNQTTAQITYSAAEAGGTMQCSTDGTTYNTCAASPVSLSGLSDGVKTYYARQVDAAGNVGAPASATWTVDTAAPAAPSVGSNRSGSTSQTTATITYTPAEAGGTMECSTNGTTFSACAASPISLSGLSDGTKTYYVRQVDAAGNTGSVASVTWVVDTAAPAAPSVGSNRSGSTSETTAQITYSAAEPGGTMQCSTDGTTYAGCSSSPINLHGLTDGPKAYYVRQVDAAGNVGAVASATWTVDTIAPATPSISSDRSGTVNSTTAQITYSGIEPGGVSECSDDGTTFAPCAPSPINLSGLSDGTHYYFVRQHDAAGNVSGVASVSWIVDTLAPAAPSVSSNRSGSTAETSAEITYAAAEPGGTLECSFDGGTFAPCDPSPIELTALTDGSHSVALRQRDAGGNTGPETSVSWTVDTTAPAAPTVSSDRSGAVDETTATITYSPAEAGGTLECSTDGLSYSPCPPSPRSLSGLADGPQQYFVRQIDDAGNVGAAAQVTWTVDTVAPTLSITDPADGSLTNDATPAVTFAAADATLSAIDCAVDAGSFSACTSPWTVPALSDGTHILRVRVTDGAGHVANDSIEVTVDTAGPDAPLITQPAGDTATNNVRPEIRGSAEAGSAVKIFDGATLVATVTAGGDGSWAWTPGSDLGDGVHVFTVTATDAAGNESSPSPARTITVDTGAPSAPVVNGPNANSNNPESTVSFSASPDTVDLQCSFNGGPFSSCPSSPLSLGELPDGGYTFTVTAYDAAGNSAATTISWNVDTVAPSAPTITGGPSGQIASTSAEFSFTGAEAGGTFKCQLGSSPAVTCASPFDYTGLADGTYTFHVRQIDAAGNVSPQTSRTWTVDTTPPPAPVVSGPTSPSGFTSAAVTFSDTEPGVTFQCSVDGATAQPCTSPLSLTGLSDGTHTVEVRAYDAAGNGSAPQTATWEVDHSLFTANIAGAPTGVVNSATATLTLTATLPGSTFECSRDGAPFASCSSPVSLSGLSEGDHTFSARAINGAQQSSEVTRTWTVDTVPPSISVTSPTADQQIASDAPSVTFIAESGAETRCKLDSGVFAACTSPYDLSGLAEGAHTVSIEATDAAGNAATAVVTFVVDLTAPSATIGGGPAEGGRDNDPTPTFTLSSSEPGTFECEVDGGGYAPCTSPFSPVLGSPLDGEHTVSVRAIDAAGNISSAQTRTWTVDTQAPAAPSIDHPADNISTSDSTPTVSGDAGSAEALSHVDVYVGGVLSGSTVAAADGSWSYTPSSALGDNSYEFTAKSRDAAGNISAASNAVHIRVDAASPTAQITSKPAAVTNSAQATFTFTANEPATFECRLDSGSFAACTAPALLTGLSDGVHKFFVRAKDSSGNLSPVVEWDWSIDTTPPVVEVTSNVPAAGLSPTFSFSSNESGTTYKCRIDGAGAFTTCSSPFSAPTLAPGSHTLEVQFTDPAGNTAVKSVAFTIAAPVDSGNGGEGGGSAPTCTGSGDEPGIPANISVISVTSKKNQLKFITESDQFVLIRVSVFNGSKRVGDAVRPNGKGRRIVAIKTKRALPRNKTYVVKLSAITMSGGKSVAQAQLAIDGKGKATLLAADGQAGGGVTGAVSCGPEKGAPKIKVKVTTVKSVKVSVKKMTVSAKASDYAVAYFKVIQGGKTVARRVFVLQPKKNLKAPLKLLAGKQLVKGKAIVQITTATVDGVWQTFKKPITVK